MRVDEGRSLAEGRGQRLAKGEEGGLTTGGELRDGCRRAKRTVTKGAGPASWRSGVGGRRGGLGGTGQWAGGAASRGGLAVIGTPPGGGALRQQLVDGGSAAARGRSGRTTPEALRCHQEAPAPVGCAGCQSHGSAIPVVYGGNCQPRCLRVLYTAAEGFSVRPCAGGYGRRRGRRRAAEQRQRRRSTGVSGAGRFAVQPEAATRRF
jgi:hypothetical protein